MDKITVLKHHGISDPALTVRIAEQEHLPVSAAAALLIMESGGGRNVWGHDPAPNGGTSAIGGRTVTEWRYRAYRTARNRGQGNQGVGPVQLTGKGYQDEADKRGGAWVPAHNMSVGFEALADLHRAYGTWQRAFQHYNGSGPAAVAYGKRAAAIMQVIHAELVE